MDKYDDSMINSSLTPARATRSLETTSEDVGDERSSPRGNVGVPNVRTGLEQLCTHVGATSLTDWSTPTLQVKE